MDTFAKIFVVDSNQVLFTKEYDVDNDVTKVVKWTSIDGLMAKISLEFKGSNQEQNANKYFDVLDQVAADNFYRETVEFIRN